MAGTEGTISLMMETMGSRRRLVVVAASVVRASEDLAGSAAAEVVVTSATSEVVLAAAGLLVVTASASEVVTLAASEVVTTAASEVVTTAASEVVLAAASGVVEDSVVGAASEVVGTRTLEVVVSSAATEVVGTDSSVEVSIWAAELLRVEEGEVVGIDEEEDTTPVGPMMMTGVLVVVSSSGTAEVVAAGADREVVGIGSSSVSVGWRMAVGRPPVDELRSATVVSSEEDSWVVSSADSAVVLNLLLESSGAKNEEVTGDVGAGDDSRVVETIIVVPSRLEEVRPSDEVGSEDSLLLVRKSVTLFLMLVTKFGVSDRVSKGVVSAGGKDSGLVVLVFVNWRLT